MQTRIAGFRGEYLWELDICEAQVLALAGAIPAELYRWRPVADARSLSEVLVHIVAGNLMLLRLAGMRAPGKADLYGPLEGDPLTQGVTMVRKNVSLEKTVSDKQAIVDLLKASFNAVRKAFTSSTDDEIGRTGNFFGESTTVRRVYLRMLAHSHQHMGQLVAYTRCNGLKVPWPDPLKELDRLAGQTNAT
jgi:uncharacterized damage-inducible protein DinB